MLFLLISAVPFLLLLSKPLPLNGLPSWATDARLLPLALVEELILFSLTLVRNCRSIIAKIVAISSVMASKKKRSSQLENTEDSPKMSVLDLPELALECILGKLSPVGLCSMAGVCRCLRERCKSDYFWERHMREKWGRVIGPVAQRVWQRRLTSTKEPLLATKANPNRLLVTLSCVWPLSWFKLRLDGNSKHRSPWPDDSTMSCFCRSKGASSGSQLKFTIASMDM
ncbi:hypothetical protein HPP92_013905 [Vanilla planifolia]|uniref:F-box domain-containing protein n=1 Tax=Vanilla planifolia TaxID=51239 RepID=A0A835QQW8_VANPL|nr:hypothetical protein HPP92_013905 [Vanilla planifolia]